MELTLLIKKLKMGIRVLAVWALIGMLTGLVLFFIPAKYQAVGSLYIGRKTDNTSKYFTYEGHYGQQTAIAYANTVIAFLESRDVLKNTLNKMNITATEHILSRYEKNISVKKPGPQLITLTVRAENYERAKLFWNTLSDTTIETSEKLGLKSDHNLKIIRVTDEPVINKAYKSLPIYLAVGLLAGATLATVYISMKEYFILQGKNGDSHEAGN